MHGTVQAGVFRKGLKFEVDADYLVSGFAHTKINLFCPNLVENILLLILKALIL